MKTRIEQALIALALMLAIYRAAAQGTVFTYQGRLIDGGSPASNTYDMSIALCSTATSPGGQVGSPVLLTAVPATNGLFMVTLDNAAEFGANPFDGTARWLEISVRAGHGSGAYTTLLPRQPLLATPYAIYSGNAATLAGQASTAYVAKAGDTMTGPLTVEGDLVADPNDQGFPANLAFTASSVDGTAIYCHAYGLPFHAHNDFGGQDVTLGGGNAGIFMGGNVGIGTISPGGTLSLFNSGSDLIFKTEDRRTAVSGDFLSKQAFYDYAGEAAYIGLRHNQYLGNAPRCIAFGVSGSELMRISNNGNVGIGTTTPTAKLHVFGNSAPGTSVPTGTAVLASGSGDGGYNRFMSVEGNQAVYVQMYGAGGYGEVSTYDYGTGQGLELKLNANGGTVSVPVLEIRGGSDLAEPFQTGGNFVPKGSVMIIDETHAGGLKISTGAYDSRVAGIVSGANGINPGISLRQEGAFEGGQNIALSGRVYALADASNGPIKPGDLLTTSDTPGRCMKAADPVRAQGAVIGKAMSSLENGKGMVLVLVSLQ